MHAVETSSSTLRGSTSADTRRTGTDAPSPRQLGEPGEILGTEATRWTARDHQGARREGAQPTPVLLGILSTVF